MFNISNIVETAITSFNNSALFSPYFFIITLLSMPLFYICYTKANLISNILPFKLNIFNLAIISEGLIFFWVILIGGNYSVLRDFSLIIYILPILLFILTISFFNKLKQIKIQGKLSPFITWLYFLLIILTIIIVNYTNIISVLLNISAFISGLIVSSYSSKFDEKKIILKNIFLLIFISSLVFMQPEFFKFGQLGKLTLIHLIFYTLLALFLGQSLSLFFINAKNKFSKNIFNKIKIILRIILIINIILFLLTEALPLFFALIFIFFSIGCINILHSDKKSQKLINKFWGLSLLILSIILIIPFLTCASLIFISKNSISIKEIKKML